MINAGLTRSPFYRAFRAAPSSLIKALFRLWLVIGIRVICDPGKNQVHSVSLTRAACLKPAISSEMRGAGRN